jgi:hypothetical protein
LFSFCFSFQAAAEAFGASSFRCHVGPCADKTIIDIHFTNVGGGPPRWCLLSGERGADDGDEPMS